MLSVSDAPTIREAHERTKSTAARAFQSDGRAKSHRRVPVKRERHPLVVAGAIPEGSCRAPRASLWLALVREHPEVALMRSDCRDNLLRLCRAMLGSLHARSMTVCPGWAHLTTTTGLSESTVQRGLRRLSELGLLGTVAKGRSAPYTPARTGRVASERAVYVLAIPNDLLSVDRTDPPTREGFRRNPTRARARLHELKMAAATPRDPWAEPEGLDQAGAHRHVERWTRTQTMPETTRRAEARDARLCAAETLAQLIPALRGESRPWIAAVIRPFLDAGWTLGDICHAVDHRPDSARIPHDGAHSVALPARWLAHRLTAWQGSTGAPLASQRQRQLAEQGRLHAEARAAQDRAARRRAHLNRHGVDPRAAAAAHRGAEMVRAELRRVRAQGASQQLR